MNINDKSKYRRCEVKIGHKNRIKQGYTLSALLFIIALEAAK